IITNQEAKRIDSLPGSQEDKSKTIKDVIPVVEQKATGSETQKTTPTSPERAAAIKDELESLQKKYEKKSKSMGPMVPPAIKADVLNSITKKMDKLDAELAEINSGQKDEAQKAKPTYGANNKIFTEDRANKAREILRKKLGQLNTGLDPELLSAGIELAGYHIEAGARKFADYAKSMIADLGDSIRPYLKSFYNAVRDYPGLDNAGMDSYGDVTGFDVNTIKLEAANGNQDQRGSGRLSESLEEVPAQNVQGNDEGRNAGTGGDRRSGTDGKGAEPTGKPGGSLRSSGRNDTEQIRLHPGGRREQSGSAGEFGVEAGETSKPAEKRHTLESRSEDARSDLQAATDYRISPKTKLGEGGQKTKYKNNVAAIRLLKDLISNDRAATPEEQDTLARYVGWGGISQAFDESNSDWSKEFKELKELLTSEEWDAAFESTQYAHYTSEQIIRGMYGALNRLGFSNGKVLEPGSGVGNFIGLLPDDMVGKVRFTAVERDSISAEISKHLYPNHNMQNADFAEFNTADGSFDCVFGNPPFSDTPITDKSGRKHLSGLHVHNYFFAKSLDLLREGGIMGMVVSNSFLDAKNDRARRYIGDRAELLGAVRLPNNAFTKTAGTEVTTDIVFLQKYSDKDIGGKLAKENREKWESLVLIPDPWGGEQIPINKYYADHPEMLLGTMERSGTMYRADQPALIAFADKNLSALLENAIKNLPENAYQSLAEQATKAIEQGTIVALQNPDARVGNYYVHGMSVYRRIADIDGETRAERITPDTPISEKKTLGFSGIERIKLLSALRETVRRQLSYETTGYDRMEENRKKLNEQYDEYLKKYDHLNSEGTRRVFKSDPDYPLLMSLEHKYKAGVSKDAAKKMGSGQIPAKAIKAPIFTTR
ncbi:MAG: methyltransferase, partial [Desulfatirhabdiaceae bacterium]